MQARACISCWTRVHGKRTAQSTEVKGMPHAKEMSNGRHAHNGKAHNSEKATPQSTSIRDQDVPAPEAALACSMAVCIHERVYERNVHNKQRPRRQAHHG